LIIFVIACFWGEGVTKTEGWMGILFKRLGVIATSENINLAGITNTLEADYPIGWNIKNSFQYLRGERY